VAALHGSPFEKYLHPFPGLLKKKKKNSKLMWSQTRNIID
jgi:hypothetical protein